MYKIQANPSGTRSIEVSDQHLETIDKYQLLRNLVDSNGIIDEEVLDKLKFNVRSLLESSDIKDKDLLDLCLDVIYNQNMKALGAPQPRIALRRLEGKAWRRGSRCRARRS